MALTIAYITARTKPRLEWFFESLVRQIKPIDNISVIVVDAHATGLSSVLNYQDTGLKVTFTPPKPTVWQGRHKLTKEDWWAASNARNTALCMCRTDWIAYLDDRCVLMPTWFGAVKEAMASKYAVCGAYQKRTGITVEKGVIRHAGIVIGEDSREEYVNKHWNGAAPAKCPGEWWFGCTNALPVEWALQINGWDETCDGSSMEDVIFGTMLQNSGFPIMYDHRMKIIEDRTPEELGKPMRREDKGVSPNDKSHALLHKLQVLKKAEHQWNIRDLRRSTLNGASFPIPTQPTKDWYDGQRLSEF